MDDNERDCYCNNCKYCKAYLSSDNDYESNEYVCPVCNGGGCIRCEEEQ